MAKPGLLKKIVLPTPHSFRMLAISLINELRQVWVIAFCMRPFQMINA